MAGYEGEATALEILAIKLRYAKEGEYKELLKESATALLGAAKLLRKPYGGDVELLAAITDLFLSVGYATVTDRDFWVQDYSRFDKAMHELHRLYGPVQEISL